MCFSQVLYQAAKFLSTAKAVWPWRSARQGGAAYRFHVRAISRFVSKPDAWWDHMSKLPSIDQRDGHSHWQLHHHCLFPPFLSGESFSSRSSSHDNGWGMLGVKSSRTPYACEAFHRTKSPTKKYLTSKIYVATGFSLTWTNVNSSPVLPVRWHMFHQWELWGPNSQMWHALRRPKQNSRLHSMKMIWKNKRATCFREQWKYKLSHFGDPGIIINEKPPSGQISSQSTCTAVPS